ncbi:MAG: hypothetical protein GY698_11900 [Actinomycetia bacterium]|nr:hypothetical protein [Actinomycetes bacterium]
MDNTHGDSGQDRFVGNAQYATPWPGGREPVGVEAAQPDGVALGGLGRGRQ